MRARTRRGLDAGRAPEEGGRAAIMSESTPQPALERPSVTDSPSGDATEVRDAEETHRRLRSLPPEVGAVLVAVGLVEFILPLPLGLPFLLAGGLILAPRQFHRVERWVTARFPKMHRAARRQLDRFIDDFQKRYPRHRRQITPGRDG